MADEELKGYMGSLPELNQGPSPENIGLEDDSDVSEFLDFAMASTSYAGKIDQTEVPVPLTMMATGHADYDDQVNVANGYGYNIGTPDVPGVVMPDHDSGREYDGSTGFASNIVNKDVYNKVTMYAKKYGIDPNFFHALVNHESGYNPNAKSKAGAMGLGQLMPDTAKGLGVTNAYDIDQNLDGAARLIKSHIDQFGNYGLALAAYNAGAGAVKKYGGIPKYGETMRYVPNIMAAFNGGNYIKGTYPITFSFKNNSIKFVDKDTGLLSLRGLQEFKSKILESPVYKNNLKYIATNRPELLYNKPEYADYAEFRRMRGTDGKPLFRHIGDFNGFKVHVSNEAARKLGVLNSNAIPAIADNVTRTQSKVLPQVNRDSAEALISSFQNNYGDIFKSALTISGNGKFGLANMTAKEYMEYGVPYEALNNPVLQARVLTQEFQRAVDILGSERKAIFALAGGEFAHEDSNKRKTWAEIKEDKENFTKNWFIKPSEDTATRNKINAIVSNYNNEYNRLRGV